MLFGDIGLGTLRGDTYHLSPALHCLLEFFHGADSREKEYGDFVLRVDWRLKEAPYMNPRVPVILPDGTHKVGPDGKELLALLEAVGHGIEGAGEVSHLVVVLLRGLAADVEAVCKGLDLKRVILVGHSMGGPVSLMAAKRMPDRVVAVPNFALSAGAVPLVLWEPVPSWRI